MIYNWSKWAEEFGIDGYYIDNSTIVIHITNCMVLPWVGPAAGNNPIIRKRERTMMAVNLCGIRFCWGSLVVAASAVVATQAAAGEPKLPADVPRAIRLFNCDFNWARWPPSETLPHGNVRPSLPEDWAEVDAQQYFDWHREFGNNVVYCQAYCSSGFALYPSKLGPVGKGKAARLFPELYALGRKAKLPVWS